MTIVHLKPVQVRSRIVNYLRTPNPDLRPPPKQRFASRLMVKPCLRPTSLVGPTRFLFLNQSGELNELGWDNPQTDKLWRYNQHYFDDLNARDAHQRQHWHRNLIANWIAENRPGLGTAWEPYPVSLRIVNWIKWAKVSGCGTTPDMEHSLAIQARWLMQKLEWHLLGNHLFANAKALVFSGLYFEGEEAEQWLAKGEAILRAQLPEQILPDGGHFELSPMYHALALEDILDLVNIVRSYSTTEWLGRQAFLHMLEARVASMRSWLETMTHPDGRISFFNDAAFSIAPENTELTMYAGRLGFSLASPTGHIGSRWLRESGYARFEIEKVILLMDMAAVGPDYLPGHAHADTLCFEFSMGTQRIFVNSGTSVYGTGVERLRQRGTAAHNSVIVDSKNSSDVWSGFRVGRRAICQPQHINFDGQILTAEAAHNGYRWMAGGPVHKRQWLLTEKSLQIYDQLSVDTVPAEARFHCHPDIDVCQDDTGKGVMSAPDGTVIHWNSGASPVRIEKSTWHPEFGKSFSNICIVVPLNKGHANFKLNWI